MLVLRINTDTQERVCYEGQGLPATICTDDGLYLLGLTHGGATRLGLTLRESDGDTVETVLGPVVVEHI